MDKRENPNYYTVDKPYKSKYICVKCRKAFKRRVLSDITDDKIEEKEPKCPECGNLTSWIGPKFRPPKSDNLKAWNSIRVLNDIGVLYFLGWSSGTVVIPETNKSLLDMLTEMKKQSELTINQWTTMEYNEGHKTQIKYFSEFIRRIDNHLKKV